MGLDVSICIVTYRARDLLRDCLRSIHETVKSLSFEIIVVDNHSEDGTLEMIKTEFHAVRLVVNDHNTGYTRPNNQAMRESKGSYILLLNPDTIVTLGWARKMRACAYSRQCIATVTPFTNNGTECSILELGQSNEVPEGFTIESFAELVENCSVNQYPELVTAVGFCMYIRRAVIEEIGYLDEENFGLGYGEENDFSMRATRKGYKNVGSSVKNVRFSGRR
jgi:O-antigen biosynthesis protein